MALRAQRPVGLEREGRITGDEHSAPPALAVVDPAGLRQVENFMHWADVAALWRWGDGSGSHGRPPIFLPSTRGHCSG